MNKNLSSRSGVVFGRLIGLMLLLTGCSQTPRYQPLEWKVGQWVAYEFNGKPIKISIVAKDSNLFWIETAESEVIVKLLVTEHNLSEPKKLIIKKLADIPVEFPLDKFSINSQFPTVKIDGSSVPEKELLTLQCGKFKTFHITEGNNEIWLANNVPILGIVKSICKNETLVLRAYGNKGASSEIQDEARVSEFIG